MTGEHPLTGLVVGERYRLGHPIGEGGMGEVFAGEHLSLGRAVAVKILKPPFAAEARAVERFFREARAASALGHPNICEVQDLGRLEDGRPYMVMPFLPGEDLGTYIERKGPRPAEQVVELLAGPAAALQAIHARGMVHRDIKPENMILTQLEDGTDMVKLLDFGLATLLDGDDPRLTRDGLVCGTPQYIAPEACQGALPDARGDVYALAAVAFELLTGVPPFDGPNPLGMLAAKITQDAPTLRSAGAARTFSAALEEVVARGLARDPDDRFQSPGELVSALRRAITDAGRDEPEERSGPFVFAHWDSEAPPPAQPTDDDAPAPPMRWRLPVVAAALLLILVAGATWTIVGASRESDTAPTERQATGAPDTPPARVELAEVPAEDQPTDPQADPPPQPERSPAEARPAAARARTTGARRGSTTRRSGPAAIVDDEATHLPPVPHRDPERAATLSRRATTELVRGMLPRAIELFRESTLSDPGHAPAWRGLGLSYERLGRPAEARRAYQRYLRLAPRARDADSIRLRLAQLSGGRGA